MSLHFSFKIPLLASKARFKAFYCLMEQPQKNNAKKRKKNCIDLLNMAIIPISRLFFKSPDSSGAALHDHLARAVVTDLGKVSVPLVTSQWADFQNCLF